MFISFDIFLLTLWPDFSSLSLNIQCDNKQEIINQVWHKIISSVFTRAACGFLQEIALLKMTNVGEWWRAARLIVINNCKTLTLDGSRDWEISESELPATEYLAWQGVHWNKLKSINYHHSSLLMFFSFPQTEMTRVYLEVVWVSSVSAPAFLFWQLS